MPSQAWHGRYSHTIVSHFCSESRSIGVTSGLPTTPDLDTGQQAPGKRLRIKYWLVDPFPERGAKDKRVASPEGPQFHSAGSLEVLDAVTPGVLESQAIGRFRTQAMLSCQARRGVCAAVDSLPALDSNKRCWRLLFHTTHQGLHPSPPYISKPFTALTQKVSMLRINGPIWPVAWYCQESPKVHEDEHQLGAPIPKLPKIEAKEHFQVKR